MLEDKNTKILKSRKKMKPLSKKRCDKECCFKKHKLRKISNQKHRDPLNANLREQYYYTLTEYKKLLKKKKMSSSTQKALS